MCTVNIIHKLDHQNTNVQFISSFVQGFQSQHFYYVLVKRFQKSIDLHSFTDCFIKISPLSLEERQLMDNLETVYQ